MGELAGLAAFSFVRTVTPGPNNVMLWASGVQFGLRPTLPHVAGISIGIGTMAAGLGVLVTAVPEVELTLRGIGSLYLLYLAYQVAGLGAATRARIAQPLSLRQAIAFQYVNPKAWVFVLAAITAFRPEELHVVVGHALMVLVMMIVVAPSALIWAAGGTVLNRFVTEPRSGRTVSVVLAALLAATIVYMWV